MPLTPEHRAELLSSTKGAAAALVDDLQHVRSTVESENPSQGEIRRLAVLLRRIVIEGDLAAISAPRLGKVKLVGPDNNPAYRAERKKPFLFYMSGRAKVLGGFSGTIAVHYTQHPTKRGAHVNLQRIEDSATMEMTLDNFRNQKVLCYRGQWVMRKDVIKYVAIVGHGVHSATAKDNSDVTLSYIRNCTLLRPMGEGVVQIHILPGGIRALEDATFRHEPDAIDPVLVELLASARFLVQSPFISELEWVILRELNDHRRPA